MVSDAISISPFVYVVIFVPPRATGKVPVEILLAFNLLSPTALSLTILLAVIVFEPLIGPNIPETVEIVLAVIVFEPVILP